MNKLTDLAELVRANIPPGCTVCFAGMSHLMPFATAHEIIRQGIRGLTVVRTAPDVLVEQLALAGCVERLLFSWIGNPGLGLLHQLRRDLQGGEIAYEEYTHHALLGRLAAGAMGLPFFPVRSLVATDLSAGRDDIGDVVDPFTGERWPVVPPLRPDVTVVHAQRSDDLGNVQVWGLLGEIKEAAFAARKVVVTAEEIVATDVLARDPNRVVVPQRKVAAVAHVPWGAHPAYAQGCYDRDTAFYEWWWREGRNRQALLDWITESVIAPGDHAGYLRVLGRERLEALVPPERTAPPVNYGAYQ